MRCLNFLEKPTEGQVFIEGRELGTMDEKQLRKQRMKIAMIFQNFNLLGQKNSIDRPGREGEELSEPAVRRSEAEGGHRQSAGL